MATFEHIDPDGDIVAALQGIHNRLDTLASITTGSEAFFQMA